jgi:Putative zinc- or iron-chelating domain
VSLIALGKDYPSIFSAPVIRAVDTSIFTLRYFTHCMSCGFCKDQCCSYGVDIDRDNMERLRTLGTAFETFTGVSQAEWFTEEIVEDREFPSSAHGRTRAVGGKCVFADRQDRGCKIHAYCLANALDYHLYKPMVSILFPLTFEHGVLEPSSEVVDGSLLCCGDGPSVYDGMRDEVAYFFGEDLIGTLDVLRDRSR